MLTEVDLLSDVSLFAPLDDEERAVLARHIDQRRFPAGATIFRYGEPGGTMFVIHRGEVELWLFDEDKHRVTLGTFGDGEFFGELSLFDEEPRSATATTLADTDVLVVDREDLHLLFTQKPTAALDVLSVLSKRLRQTNEIVRSRASRNVNELFEEKLTIGQRLADKIAEFGGSWPFVTLFLGILAAWIAANSVAARPFDPFPFILLNLALSCLAALQAPIIMMSQNRANAKDRLRAELDYRVNVKAELEIGQLHDKLDDLRQEVLRALASARSNPPA
jgi:uncharacterized membrane protein